MINISVYIFQFQEAKERETSKICFCLLLSKLDVFCIRAYIKLKGFLHKKIFFDML